MSSLDCIGLYWIVLDCTGLYLIGLSSLFGNNEIDDTETASKDLALLGLFLAVFGHQFHYSLKTEH